MIPNECVVLCSFCRRILDVRYAKTLLDETFHSNCKREYIALQHKLYAMSKNVVQID